MLLSPTAKLLHVMLKRRLNLFTAENNSESVDVLTHSNTGTPGTVTCLPVAAVECLKLHRCQPSRNRAGNPANLVVSRIPAFFPKHPAFLGFFGGEKNRRNSQ